MKVAINGFGPAGRAVFRQLQGRPQLQVAAINDPADGDTLALLARRDSARGAFPGRCELSDGCLLTDAGSAVLLSGAAAATPPWRDLGVAVVVEADGGPHGPDPARHLAAGAGHVVLVGPGRCTRGATVLRGAGDGTLPAGPAVLATGSGPANCLALLATVLDGAFGLESALMTATGPVGADQLVADGPHGDARRGRAAGLSLVPVASGAAAAVVAALPQFAGRLAALSVRAPVASGTAVDLVAVLRPAVTVAAVNAAFLAAAAEPRLAGLLAVAEDPLVSADAGGSTLSCLFDPGCTRLAGDRTVGLLAWCDAEWAAAARACDLLERLASGA